MRGRPHPQSFQAAHRQAAGDAAVFRRTLQEVEARLERLIEAECRKAEAAAAAAAAAQESAASAERALLAEKEAEVAAAKEDAATAGALALAKERAERLEVMPPPSLCCDAGR